MKIVFESLEKQYPLDSSTFYQLTMKTVMPIALSTGQRAQTISCIRLDNIKENSDGIQIKITDIIKKSIKESKQLTLKLPCMKETPELCPATTVKKYLEVTADLRGDIKYLFITLRIPHRAVTMQTISRWLKRVLHKSGLTSFTGHSTRHAATSAAFQLRQDPELINENVASSKKSRNNR